MSRSDFQDFLIRKIKEMGKQMEKYDEEYRETVYPKLTAEEKDARNLREINGKLYCDKLIKARNRKFQKEADEIVSLVANFKQRSSPAEVYQQHPQGILSLLRTHQNNSF